MTADCRVPAWLLGIAFTLTVSGCADPVETVREYVYTQPPETGDGWTTSSLEGTVRCDGGRPPSRPTSRMDMADSPSGSSRIWTWSVVFTAGYFGSSDPVLDWLEGYVLPSMGG